MVSLGRGTSVCVERRWLEFQENQSTEPLNGKCQSRCWFLLFDDAEQKVPSKAAQEGSPGAAADVLL